MRSMSSEGGSGRQRSRRVLHGGWFSSHRAIRSSHRRRARGEHRQHGEPVVRDGDRVCRVRCGLRAVGSWRSDSGTAGPAGQAGMGQRHDAQRDAHRHLGSAPVLVVARRAHQRRQLTDGDTRSLREHQPACGRADVLSPARQLRRAAQSASASTPSPRQRVVVVGKLVQVRPRDLRGGIRSSSVTFVSGSGSRARARRPSPSETARRQTARPPSRCRFARRLRAPAPR